MPDTMTPDDLRLYCDEYDRWSEEVDAAPASTDPGDVRTVAGYRAEIARLLAEGRRRAA